MKRRKISGWVLCVLYLKELTVIYCSTATTESSSFDNVAVEKFQSSLQQQNTISILSSIEERLRNLDNIYSMQLSQTLETKLDIYNGKLENLDSKITRLEGMVMLNLGKISENISTKNFKDDLVKTDILRKLDSIYEGITHRLNYIERKLDTNSVKFQERIEAAFSHLDKIEKDAIKRDANLEIELSATILRIKDLATTYKNMEKKILNLTEDNLNVSKHTFGLLSKYNVENRKSMNKLHDNIIGNLQYIDNKTSQHMKISDDTNTFLKQMKIDLKDDFNNYANKVADMNSDIWKSTDTTEDDLKNIGLIVNSTRTELQNGIRSLMIQVGKVYPKTNELGTGADYKDLEKALTTNFEKILTNQDVFLESCHRLQMDESQIESEISVMLNKLIDMLEKKLSTETKDIKSFEKNLKNHDNRINRNLLQANQNLISLFEKTTINTQTITNEIRKIGTDINALFTFIRSTINDGSASTSVATSKVMIDKLILIEKSTQDMQYILYNKKPENISHFQVYKEIQKLSKLITTMIENAQNSSMNCSSHLSETSQNMANVIKKVMEKCNSSPEVQIPLSDPKKNETIRELVARVFGDNQKQNNQKPKRKCKQNYRNLIDIRADVDCVETTHNPTKKPKRRKMKYDIDIRSDLNSDNDYEDTTSTTDEVTSTSTEEILSSTILSGIL